MVGLCGVQRKSQRKVRSEVAPRWRRAWRRRVVVACARGAVRLDGTHDGRDR
jgi:hypothetical protein